MKKYGETIYGTSGSFIEPQDWGVVTAKGQSLYVHLLKPTGKNYLFISGFTKKVATAVSFPEKKKMKFKQQPEGLFIYLEGIDINTIDTVIELKLQ